GHHDVVRNYLIEVRRPGADGPLTPPDTMSCCEEHADEAQGRRHRRRQPVTCESNGQESRPAIVFVRSCSNLGQCTWHVDPEFVGGRVLTGVKAFAAVVAEVCEVRQVNLRKGETTFHRGEDRTVRFAVPAGVAHSHDVLAVSEQVIREHARRPPCLRSVRTRFLSSFPRRRHSLCREYYPP